MAGNADGGALGVPALDGLTVLEFSSGSRAAALAGVLLADNGARVVKVEPPEGDRMRSEQLASHLVLDRGKESVVIDLHTPEGRSEAQRLAAEADVVIVAFHTGVAEDFGIAYEDLREENPGLVHCSISGFGSEGPYAAIKAYEHVVQAKTGMFSLGQAGMFGYRPGPIFVNAPLATTGAGHLAAAGVVAALTAREVTGEGQRLEVPLYQGLNPTDYFGLITWQIAEGRTKAPARSSAADPSRKVVAASRFSYMPCSRDGRFVFFTAMLPHQTRAILRALDLEALYDDPRFASAPFFDSAEAAQDWEDRIWETFRERSFDEWDKVLRQDEAIAYELVRTSEEGLDHPQLRHNGEVVTIDSPGVGPVEQLGPIARFERSPACVERPAPALGINGGFGAGATTVGRAGPAPEHPLAGFTVVEFGYFYAVPFSTALAASLGARVIKIEDRQGDPQRRGFGVPESGTAKTLEGKESISVDLSTPEGIKVVHDLIAQADAFVNGFRPGTAERRGVDYATLSKINPRLVYLHATGYGTDGEFAPRPIYAQCAQAVAGGIDRHASFWLASDLTQEMGASEIQAVILPRTRTVTDGDSNAALANNTALTMALYHQRRTGEGQFLTTSMIGANAWAYADDAVRFEGKVPRADTDPDFHGIAALYRLYSCAEGWVFLAAPRQKEWERLVAAVGEESLAADSRFASVELRRIHEDELIAALEDIFAQQPAVAWEELLIPRGVACVAVCETTFSEFSATDPVLRETGLTVEIEHPVFGPTVRHGLPVQFSETPGRLATAPLLGQHTRALLEELGYGTEAVAALERSEVVYCAP